MSSSLKIFMAPGDGVPKVDEMKDSPLAALVSELVEKHADVFGVDRELEYKWVEGRICGCLSLKVGKKQDGDGWVHCFTAEVSPGAFKAAVLPDDFKAVVHETIEGWVKDLMTSNE